VEGGHPSFPLRPPLECCVQHWAPSHTEDLDLPEQVQQRAAKAVKGGKHLAHKERLRELGLFRLEKRGLKGVSPMCINM